MHIFAGNVGWTNKMTMIALGLAVVFAAGGSRAFAEGTEASSTGAVGGEGVERTEVMDGIGIQAEAIRKARELREEILKKEAEARREAQKQLEEGKPREAVQTILDARREVRKDAAQQADSVRGQVREHNEGKIGTSTLRRVSDERRAEVAQKIGQRREALIRAYAERMIRRFEAALERLTRLGDRLELRLIKLEENGIDVAHARELLGESRNKIQEARGKIAETETEIYAALGSDDPKEAFGKVRELLKGAVEKIKEAHRALVDAVRAIKGPAQDVQGGSEENTDDDADNGTTTESQ